MKLSINKVVLVVSMVMISTFIIGCKDTGVSVDIIKPPEIENKYDNLIIKDVKFNKENKLISFNVENKGNTPITTSLHYKIEKYDDNDGWIKTNLTDNIAFIEIAIMIQEYETLEEVIDLSNIDKLNDGYYRIVKTYYDEINSINGYIEFKVVGEEISDIKAYNNISK